MPHLSPLNWLLTPMIFWLGLLSLISISWWSQTISFPYFPSQLTPPKTTYWIW